MVCQLFAEAFVIQMLSLGPRLRCHVGPEERVTSLTRQAVEGADAVLSTRSDESVLSVERWYSFQCHVVSHRVP